MPQELEISPDFDLSTDLGFMLVNDLRYAATNLNVQVTEWEVIQDWLCCKNRDFNEADKLKINKAWESYKAAGIAPSVSSQTEFDKYKTSAAKNQIEIIDVPLEIKNVFDHLIATEKEIRIKRVSDACLRKIKEEKAKSKSSFLGNMKYAWKTNIIVRKYCFGSCCWIIAVLVYPLLFRDSYYGYNGFFSTENQYLKIAFFPSFLFGLGLYIYRKFIR
ncbi:MAG: hypothetical protein ABFD50_01110 [Smithella sp.]